MPDTLTDPDWSAAWGLHPRVSLRDEAFGALAYHHDTRRLVFLKSPGLVTVVRRLDEFASVSAALDALIGADKRRRYELALASLATSGIIRGR